MKAFGVVLLLVLLAAGGVWWFVLRDGSGAGSKVRLRTARADRGEVVEGIAASGTVQPVELVQVGTQISGVIQRILVDFNSKVKADETIALLDSRRLQSQVAQDEAAVARAKADVDRVQGALAQAKAEADRVRAAVVQSRAEADKARAQATQAKADVGRVQALLAQAQADLARQKQLVEKRLTSPSDVDAAVALEGSLSAQLAVVQAAVAQSASQVAAADASVLQSEAQVAVAEASVRQSAAQVAVAEASVRQSEAQLAGNRVNLDFATIKSPVDGVVVSRNVDVGQTVAASLQAPTLFQIARDLTKVQVQTSVPEADIGRIHEKQPASFLVDAYPDRTFDGVVTQVRLASTTSQNVVTYTVVVDASNPDGLLFPGMTATVTFEVARSAKDALRVPASALRLQPAADLVEGGGEAPPARGAGGPPRGGKGRRGGTVYVPTPEGRLRPVRVRPGVSDGVNTAVEPADPKALVEGTEVVTAILKEEEPTTTNPFAPPRMGGPRGGR